MLYGKYQVIFSVEPKGKMLDNLVVKTLLYQAGLLFQESTGCYKGTQEQSIVVTIDSPEQLALIKAITRIYKQESILHIDDNNNAALEELDNGKVTPLGTLFATTREKAIEESAWTYIHNTNQFYYCK